MIKFEKLPADIMARLPEVGEMLFREDHVVFAYLFGSLAKGRVSSLSDIDIAVYVDTTDHLAEYKLHLFDRLTDILGTGELDLVILNTAPISLAGRISQKKRILVDKEPFSRHLYESITLRKFFDFQIKERDFFKRRYGIGG
ncbi:MAG: nucleotidyltransferase domain-containing protein [Nitrospirae bacterium]|nr:nucleotidyltransferase domain-containing protein [Nitrospirota bacterium]